MNQSLRIASPLDIPGWDEQVSSFPGATVFHGVAWTRVLYEAFGYKPYYLCLPDRAGGWRACFPLMEVDSALLGRRGKTLPFTDYCDPLGRSPEDIGELFEAALALGRTRNWKSLELRGGSQVNGAFPHARTCYRHTIKLHPDREELLRSFTGATRRNIRRAGQHGLRVEHHHSAEAMARYYRLHGKTRRRQGLFPQPRRLFEKIQEHLLANGHGFISIAYREDRPVAGAIFLHAGQHAVYAYGASDPRMLMLRPNNIVMWEALQWFAGQGFDALSLGITDASNEGLRRYKNGMARQEEVLHYYRYDYREEAFIVEPESPEPSLRIAVCKRLPRPLLTAIGNLLYRHHG